MRHTPSQTADLTPPNSTQGFVTCPLEVAARFDPEELFVLTLTGAGVTFPAKQCHIPSGAHLLFHTILEPRADSITVVWLDEEQRWVLPLPNENGEQVTGISLEDYLGGVCLGYWLEGAQGVEF